MSHTPSLDDLAELVRARREDELRIGRRKAAKDGNMSPVTWQRVEEGQPVQTLSLGGVEEALGWPRGSIRRYLDGGPKPVPAAEDNDDPPAANAPSILEASHEQLLDELRRRHDALRAELERRLYPALAPAEDAETAEAVRARGMIPGLPMGEGEGGGDIARGGER